MIESVLRLRVQKRLDTDLGAVAQLLKIADAAGRPVGSRSRIDVLVPAGEFGSGQGTAVSPGLWFVEAALPSGEFVTRQVQVDEGADVLVLLQAAEPSPSDSLSWQYLIGNIESSSTLEIVQERARRTAERLARIALGKSADPVFVERLADAASDFLGRIWRLIVTPLVSAFHASTKGRFHAAKQEAAPLDEQEIVSARAPIDKSNGSLVADDWETIFSNHETYAPLIASKIEEDLQTSIYSFDRPLASAKHAPLNLSPREFAFVGWKGARFAVSLPLPWPEPDTGEGASAEVMVRRLPYEDRLQLGVAVRDRTFGPLTGFMTSVSLPQAAIAVEQLYETLFGKIDNPLAAVAAGYVLVAAGDVEKRDWCQWIGELERTYPELPDGGVLKGVLFLRYARDYADIGVAREALIDACNQGIPYFSLGVTWLQEGLEQLSGDPRVDERRGKVERVARRLDLSQVFTVVQVSEPSSSRRRPSNSLKPITPTSLTTAKEGT